MNKNRYALKDVNIRFIKEVNKLCDFKNKINGKIEELKKQLNDTCLDFYADYLDASKCEYYLEVLFCEFIDSQYPTYWSECVDLYNDNMNECDELIAEYGYQIDDRNTLSDLIVKAAQLYVYDKYYNELVSCQMVLEHLALLNNCLWLIDEVLDDLEVYGKLTHKVNDYYFNNISNLVLELDFYTLEKEDFLEECGTIY